MLYQMQDGMVTSLLMLALRAVYRREKQAQCSVLELRLEHCFCKFLCKFIKEW